MENEPRGSVKENDECEQKGDGGAGVRRLPEQASTEAARLLQANRRALERLAEALLAAHVLGPREIQSILGRGMRTTGLTVVTIASESTGRYATSAALY